MTNPLDQMNVILAVTGSIAAYKAADLASKLTQAGSAVDVILTNAALKFITPLSFQSVTARPVFTDQDLWGGQGHVTHVALGHKAQLFVIAPASANTIAKLAHGIADNLLSVAALAARCPLVIVPAMDAGMFSHPATNANIEILKQRGTLILGPAVGHLASGLVGVGRMVETVEILGYLRYLASRSGPLAGKKIVVSAGGTQEAIDPVRVITNRSSGRQGYAIAAAALNAGADVTLITTPTWLSVPPGCQVIHVLSAAEMLEQVLRETTQADALIMAAAVADFRPKNRSAQKIKKKDGLHQIDLEPTEDILAFVGQRRSATGFPRRLVGFAAETSDLLANASAKLMAKRLDLIVANDISAQDAGFEVTTNRVTFLFANGQKKTFPLLQKEQVAEEIIRQVQEWL